MSDEDLRHDEGRLGREFLAAFNEIEQHLRRALQRSRGVPLSKMLDDYAERYRLPPEHLHALKIFAGLRNTISHGNYYGGRPIADPVAQTVDQISRLRDLIVRPPLATECLEGREIAVTAPHSPISGVLDVIRVHDYSQIPVYRGGAYFGLLTTNCIARWLADRLASTSTFGDVNVEEIMRFAERDDRAKHIRRSTTAAEASDYLLTPATDGSRPRALIVTDTGASEEPPVAVIVDYDLPALHFALSLPG